MIILNIINSKALFHELVRLGEKLDKNQGINYVINIQKNWTVYTMNIKPELNIQKNLKKLNTIRFKELQTPEDLIYKIQQV